MKRCPKCNRAESDDSLAFCRTDGTRLVSDGSFVSEGAGTLRFDSAPATGETETRMLPTGEGLGRPTATTTVLGGRQPSGDTPESGKPKSLRGTLMAVAAVLAVALAVFAYLYLSRVTTGAAKNSIAVLPFQNAGGDPNLEYLSDGVTESLINSLSQLPNLAVKARSTMFRYKGQQADPQKVGLELDVQAVLTGRVLQRGDDLTLSLELVDAKTGDQMWGGRYDRKLTDLVALQSEIARDVSNKLRVKLSGADEQKLAKSYTTNPAAYQLYLQGRFYWNKRTPEDLEKATQYFERAIAADPNYALAYTGLADAYALRTYYAGLPPAELYPKARAAADRALELDDTLAEAHTALANIKDGYEWKGAEAEREFRRAIELNPNYVTARQWYAELLSRMGRHEEAVAEIERALESDPLSLIANAVAGNLYSKAGQLDKALTQLRRTTEMDKNFERAHSFAADVYEQKGMYEEAITEHQTAAILSGRLSAEAAARGAAKLRDGYRKAGARGYWQAWLELVTGDMKGRNVPPSKVASIYAHLGEKDKAIEWLEKAYQQHENGVLYLKVNREYDPLRTDPRFADLVRRVGLPQ